MNIFKNLFIEKILGLIFIFTLLLVIGLATYDKVAKESYTVVVTLNYKEDPFVKLPQCIPVDSYLTSIREENRNNNEYIITVTSKRKKKDLLEWISKIKGVENAQFK